MEGRRRRLSRGLSFGELTGGPLENRAAFSFALLPKVGISERRRAFQKPSIGSPLWGFFVSDAVIAFGGGALRKRSSLLISRRREGSERG